MAQMRPYIKEWYDYLTEGKLMGLRCKKCGGMQFPPTPVCDECGSFDTEWAEISGEGELVTFNVNPMGVYPYNTKPSMCGYVRLKEGPMFMGTIEGVRPKQKNELLKRMQDGSVEAELFIDQIDETHSYPMIRLK